MTAFFVSKTYPYVTVEAIGGASFPSWCSERHCQDCAKSEFSPCSNDASPSSCGDLCGCCQSCVQLRDLGESCGSQLAVRFSADENFGESISRVTILATSSCGRGLVCTDSVCRKRNRGKNGTKFEDQSQFSYQHYNHDDVGYQDADELEDIEDQVPSNWDFVMPGSINSATYKSQEPSDYRPDVPFGPSRRFLNLIIVDREFQLIYGRDALSDLQILLNSVNTSQPDSILNGFQAATVYERFRDLLEYIKNKNEVSDDKREINLFPIISETPNSSETESKKVSRNVFYSRKRAKSPEILVRQFRTKRRAERDEKFEDNLGVNIPSSHSPSAPKILNPNEKIDRIKGECLVHWKFPLPQNSVFVPVSNSKSPRVLPAQFRGKRQAEDTEKTKDHVRPKIEEGQNTQELLNPDQQIDITKNEYLVYWKFHLPQNVVFAPKSISKSPRVLLRQFRGKRQAEDTKKAKEAEAKYKIEGQNAQESLNPNEQINKQKSEFRFYDFTGKMPGATVDVDRRSLVAGKTSIADKLPARRSDPGDAESAINIHITGAPRPANATGNPGIKVAQETRGDSVKLNYGIYDDHEDPEESVTRDAEVVADSLNFGVIGKRSESRKNVRGEGNGNDRQLSGRLGEKSAPPAVNGESDFPEKSVPISSTDFPRELGVRVNEMATEFRDRLERIESWLKAIGSSTLEILSTLWSDEKSWITGGEAGDATPKIRSVDGNPRTREANRFIGRSTTTRRDEIGGNSTDRSHRRRWRSLVVRPRSTERGKNFPGRPDGAASDSVDREYRRNFRGKKSAASAGEKSHDRLNFQGASAGKRLEEDARLPGQIATPGLLARADYGKLIKYSPISQSGDASDGQSNFEAASEPPLAGSSAPNRRTILPLNPACSGATTLGGGERTKTPETPALRETVFALKTQIPRPIRWGQSRGFGGHEGGRWGVGPVVPIAMKRSLGGEFGEKFTEDSEGWNWDAGPLLDLFVVEDRSADSGVGSSSGTGETFGSDVQPTEEDRRKDRGAVDSWDQIYPEYLDYSERARKDEVAGDEVANAEVKTTEAPVDRRVTRQIGSGSREQRSVKTNLQDVKGIFEEFGDSRNDWREDLPIFSGDPEDGGVKSARQIGSGSRKKRKVKTNLQGVKGNFEKFGDSRNDWREELSIFSEDPEDGGAKSSRRIGSGSREQRKVKTNLQSVKENFEKFGDSRNDWREYLPIFSGDPEDGGAKSSRQIGSGSRKKRKVKTNLQGVKENFEKFGDSRNDWREDLPIFPEDPEDGGEKSSRTASGSNPSGARRRRNIQMVDWLRAAREYHERLQQVRSAALKTWLASREELEDASLANVKLFTREIPAYLEKYRPGDADESGRAIEDGGIFAVGTEDSAPGDDEFFGKVVADLSARLEDDARTNAKRSANREAEVFSSTAPRKFTIVATGNSTIRIEGMPDSPMGSGEDLAGSSGEDQSGQSSTSSEFRAGHRVDFASSEIEDFDHMYESFDAEDEDFDYEDPSFAIAKLLDGIDVIDEPIAEVTEDGTKSTSEDGFDGDYEDFEDEEVADVLGRSKRDSPFFLFKVKRSPSHEVIVWPSNWKDLVGRHLRLNRSTSIAQPRKTSRRSYVKISKGGPGLVRTLETRDENFPAGSDGLSFEGETVGDEETRRRPGALDSVRRPQRVDTRRRSSRRDSWK